MTLLRSSLVVLSSLMLASSAFAIELTPVAGLNLSSQSVSPPPAGYTYSGGLGYAFGALVALPVAPAMEVESGALFVHSKVKSTQADALAFTGTTESSWNALQIPVIARFTGLPIVSFGAGGYYASGLGKVTSKSEGNVVGVAYTNTTSSTFGDANLSKTDFGLVGDVRFRLPVAPFVGLVLDARYLHGLKDVDNGSGSTKNRAIELLAGLSLSI